MFLVWNYALESFLWILVGAILLVSLTILLARPQFRSKKSETSEEALSLTGKNVDSLRENILDQDKASGRIEEELDILDDIEKEETEQDVKKWGFLGISLRLLLLMGVIALVFGIIPAAFIIVFILTFIIVFILIYQNWDNEDATQFGKWVGNILKLLRKKWMTINTYTGIRSLLYIFAFLSVILFLAVFIFQFF
jgi:Flp pilus assembly protein TadB